jgi:hypothetical protein
LRIKLLLLVAVVGLPGIGAAEVSCPWLNAATAGGALGGSVTSVTVIPAKTGDDASCDFVRRQGSLVMELHIETETLRSPATDFASYSALARCGSDAVVLKAIGNEALACSSSGDDEVGEQVVSRVRERGFLVRIKTNDRSAKRSELREKARKIAEAVAGFLF